VVAPRQRRRLVLERADGLPTLKARVADRHRRLPGTTVLSKPRNRHARSLRPPRTHATPECGAAAHVARCTRRPPTAVGKPGTGLGENTPEHP
jgi:hypothetical protein